MGLEVVHEARTERWDACFANMDIHMIAEHACAVPVPVMADTATASTPLSLPCNLLAATTWYPWSTSVTVDSGWWVVASHRTSACGRGPVSSTCAAMMIPSRQCVCFEERTMDAPQVVGRCPCVAGRCKAVGPMQGGLCCDEPTVVYAHPDTRWQV